MLSHYDMNATTISCVVLPPQFASVANVTYPGVYQTLLSHLDIINLDIGFIVSAGCLWPGIDFHDQLLAGTILPLVLLGLLAVTYAVALRRKSATDDSVRENIRHKHLSAVLLLLFFVYSSVSSTVFRMFSCDSLEDGKEYLRVDYRILCTDEKHRALQVYAGLMIAVYPVGIPLLFVVLLYRHRDVLSDSAADKATAQSIASLWEPYKPSCFYYEVIECGRRIVLTGVVVFIYPNDTAQIAITIINSFFFFVVSEVLSPYKSASDAWLSRSGHILIFFTMFDVLLLRVDVSQESSESQHIFAGVLVTGHVVMIVAVVVESIGLCYSSRQAKHNVIEESNPSRNALRVSSSKPIKSDEEESGGNFQVPNGMKSWGPFTHEVERWEGDTEVYRRSFPR